MKNRTLSILVLILISFSLVAQETAEYDSLKTAITNMKNPQQRVDMLINLCDMTQNDSTLIGNSRWLIHEADAVGDSYAANAVLVNIALNKALRYEFDSLDIYIGDMRSRMTGSVDFDGVPDYYVMLGKAFEIISTADRKSKTNLIARILSEYSERDLETENKYQKAERLYILSLIKTSFAALAGNIPKFVPNEMLEDAYELTHDFSVYAKHKFVGNILEFKLQLAGDPKEKAIDINRAIANNDEFFENKTVISRRPDIYKEINYTKSLTYILSNYQLFADKYDYDELYMRIRNIMYDKRYYSRKYQYLANFYILSSSYYEKLGDKTGNPADYWQAYCYSDTLVNFSRTKDSHLIIKLPFQYLLQARLLRKMGKLSESLDGYEKYIAIKDSMTVEEYSKKYNDLEANYQLEKLSLEKSRSESKLRLTIVFFVSSLFVILLIIVLVLYRHYRQTTKLKLELEIQKEKALESERMKIDFINSICHEIRTPMNTILGFINVLTDQDLDDNEKAHCQDIIERNTRTLLSLINEMLEVSILNNYEDDFSKLDVDVETEVRNQIREACGIIPYDSEKVTINVTPPTESRMLRTNKDYFNKLLYVMLTNALRFTKSGTVDITWTFGTDDSFSLSVTDTGCGIPEGEEEHIFEKFVKLDTFSDGLGLGLYLARLICMHDTGKIYLDRTHQGPGSRFVFECR